MTRILTTATAGLALALVIVAGATAAPKLLENTALAGVPSGSPVVRGVTGAGLPWVVADGTMAKVSVNGELKVACSSRPARPSPERAAESHR